MIFRLLNNDPSGDSLRYGEFIAWILMIFRFAWCIILGIGMLGTGIGILIFAGMVIKVIIMIFGLFITPVPFLER